jgi:hypothetical protein
LIAVAKFADRVVLCATPLRAAAAALAGFTALQIIQQDRCI